jgi:glycogen operon protein
MDWGMTLNQLFEHSPVQWHGVKLNQPDFGVDSHAIALTVNNVRRQFTLHLMINAYWEALDFEIPPIEDMPGGNWTRWIDTAMDSPDDICSWEVASVIQQMVYTVRPRSMTVLVVLKRRFNP